MIGSVRRLETAGMAIAAWMSILCGFVALGCADDTVGSSSPDGAAETSSDASSEVSGPDAGGLNWTARASLTGADFRTIWGSGSDVFSAGIGDGVAHSGDAGNTWSVIPTGLSVAAGWPKLRHIGGSSGTDVWLVGSSSDTEAVLLHSADHGQSWQPVPVPGASELEAVWAIDPLHVLLADHDGDVFSSNDGGSSWSQHSIGADVALFALWGIGSQEVYAVGGRLDASAGPMTGAMFHSLDGGQTWTEIDVSPTGTLWNVFGTPDGQRVCAAGASASLAWTSDGGATWTAQSQVGSPSSNDLADVWMAPGDGALFFATTNGLVIDIEYHDSGGAQFRYETLPAGDDGTQSVAAIWGRGSGDAWAVGPGGTLRHRM